MMKPEDPDRPPAGADTGSDDTGLDDTALPDSYRRAMSSPPSSTRAGEAIAVAMAEYDRLGLAGGRDTASVTSILARRWRPMAAAAAAVMILAAGSVVVLTDRGGSDQLSSEVALEPTTRTAAPEPATPEPAMSEAAPADPTDPTDASGDDQIATFAEIDESTDESTAGPTPPEGASDTDPATGPPVAAIAVPGDPAAPTLRTPTDLVGYARDYAGHADTMAGPSCAPQDSTMLGHARYGGTDVAVVRLVDERIAAIDLDDCEIVAATG